MIFFLDADICIFALRGQYPHLKKAFQACLAESIKIPSLVAAELEFGALVSDSPLTAQKAVAEFLMPYEIIPFDKNAAGIYAAIRADLQQKGRMIGPNDLVIAATVLACHGTLVTHNTKEFSRISGLKFQDWTHA
ncbi:MAG: type II toxin-antitoxin system VapC family toxin [Candidatus Omnitrophica bacterium]|nr:type II toxin-antitoxin system VapC family toxin [Candidatus Omnitrophota bacterium]